MTEAPVKVRGLADPEAVARAGAGEWVRLVRAHAKGRRFRVSLSGGRTPRRVYELLAEPPLRALIEWPDVELFFGDERALPPDHADSNYRMVREAMLDPLGIAADRVHRMEAERPDLDAAARDYEAVLAKAFGIAAGDVGEESSRITLRGARLLSSPPSPVAPVFDLALMGMGADAHTASLFPDGPELDERSRWVLPVQAPPTAAGARQRLTLTLPVFDAARSVCFLVTGEEKADALAAVLEGPPDRARLPAQAVRPRTGALLWLVDRAAASKLTRTSVQWG
jgi:6-phosphogluconolactonase